MTILDSCNYKVPLWYNSPKHEASYMLNYKCASTTIRRAIGYPKKSTRAQFRAFTMVRDPLSRALSIYSEMVALNKHYGLGLKQWLLLVKEGFYDEHQIPQSYWIECAEEQGEDIRLYTTIDQVMEFLGLEALVSYNISAQHPKADKEDIELIREIWAADIELFDRVNYEHR